MEPSLHQPPDAIVPSVSIEDRIGIIFDEMTQDKERWNSDHLDAVIHVMKRLEEMRK